MSGTWNSEPEQVFSVFVFFLLPHVKDMLMERVSTGRDIKKKIRLIDIEVLAKVGENDPEGD